MFFLILAELGTRDWCDQWSLLWWRVVSAPAHPWRPMGWRHGIHPTLGEFGYLRRSHLPLPHPSSKIHRATLYQIWGRSYSERRFGRRRSGESSQRLGEIMPLQRGLQSPLSPFDLAQIDRSLRLPRLESIERTSSLLPGHLPIGWEVLTLREAGKRRSRHARSY